MRFFSSIRSVYLIAFLGVLIDQFTKGLARHYLVDRSVDFGLFRFDLVFNTGAAYGIFSNATSVLTWLGIGVIAFYLIYDIKSLAKHPLEMVAYGFILSGAIGNTMDRILFGKVTDFFNIHVIPVFNVADVSFKYRYFFYCASLFFVWAIATLD